MTSPFVPRGEAGRRFWLLLGLVAVVRVAYGLEYAQLPFYWGPLMDSLVYERQATSIVSGRFDDPTLLAFSPLYGYFLALFGSTPGLWPFAVQLGLGTLSLGLLHRIAAELYEDERAGDVALLLGLGYGMLRFFDTKIMSESLGLTLLVGSMYVQSPALTRARGAGLHADNGEDIRAGVGAGLLAGLLLGLAVLARASLLFIAALTPLVYALGAVLGAERTARGLSRALSAPLALALAMGAVFLANGLHNRAATGLFVPVIFVSSTVTTGNSATSTGDFSDFAGDDGFVSAFDVVEQAGVAIEAAHRGDSASQRGGEAGTAQSGFDFVAYLRHAPARALATLSDTETSYDYGYYGERSALCSWLLAPISFGALVLLGVCGLSLLRRPALLLLAPVVLGTFATTTLFHASSRYRLPLALALVLLTAPLLVRLADGWRRGQRRWLSTALALACLGFSARLYTYELQHPERWELLLAESAMTAGDVAVAEAHVARARRLAPDDAVLERRIDAVLKRVEGASGDHEGAEREEESRGRVPTAAAE